MHNCWPSLSVQGDAVSSFACKLKILKRRIIWSKKNVFGSLTSQKRKILSELDSMDLQIDSGLVTDDLLQYKSLLVSQYSSLIKDEEIYWKQRSKVQWLSEGDSNTDFFHRTASHHRRKNSIHFVLVNDVLITDYAEIRKALHSSLSSLVFPVLAG